MTMGIVNRNADSDKLQNTTTQEEYEQNQFKLKEQFVNNLNRLGRRITNQIVFDQMTEFIKSFVSQHPEYFLIKLHYFVPLSA
jgi:hypothetical protein